MKQRHGWFALSPACLILLLPWGARAAEEQPDIRIDRVFFAQHHVLEPNSPGFSLVGDLEALIKVQVYAAEPVPAPHVFAILTLGEERRELRLLGPALLPQKPTCDPALLPHTYADSFTAIIPKAWIQSGLAVTVELRAYDYREVGADDHDFTEAPPPRYLTIPDRRELEALRIGAPTKLVLHVFDIHFFGQGKGADFPTGWEQELASRLPVAALDIRRVPGITFPEIVMPPVGDTPSARYRSTEDYQARTGQDFDGEQYVALRWAAALKAAGGLYTFWRPYHLNIAGVHAGGQGGGYRSVSSLHRHGLILHELGHSFGLPHWLSSRTYPYKRTQYGKEQGDPARPNAGPVWGFDLHRRAFLSPQKLVDGRLVWNKDPMQGGGWGREKAYLYRHFSDYSMRRIRARFEKQAACWNQELGQYARWNPATSTYDRVLDNDGLRFPVERDVDVISLLVTANAAVPDANIMYPPIGPYKGGLVKRFDADSPADREQAMALGYIKPSGHVVLRVTQGGQTTSYVLPMALDPGDDPQRAFACSAINVPARDGLVTQADLLYYPDLGVAGTDGPHQTLYQWSATP